MKRITLLLALLAAGWGDALAAPASTNSAAFNRILMIDASSMPVAGGRATLTIGTLRRADGVYTGDYKLKVFPYFLKNDKSRLAILISDESMAEINLGNVTTVIGTATTSDRDGRSLHIDATRRAGEHRSRKPQAVVYGGRPENDLYAGLSLCGKSNDYNPSHAAPFSSLHPGALKAVANHL